jgi:hypothetical protein
MTNDRDRRSAVIVRTLAVGGNPRQKSENNSKMADTHRCQIFPFIGLQSNIAIRRYRNHDHDTELDFSRLNFPPN